MIQAPSTGVSAAEPGLADADNTPAPKPRLHLTYLDGLRGLAAFYVLLHHLYMKVAIDSEAFPFGFSLMAFGGLAVDVFIVLSGYCLMLPVVRSADAELSGGVKTFLKRRAWRILPPYYASLAVAIAMLWGSQRFSSHYGTLTTTKVSGLSPGPLLSHLFLVHNLVPSWAFSIDGAMWSVATEWQIYFFLPALLLPLWKRWGSGALLGGAWALGLLPRLLHWDFADSAHPWLLGLFAMGMAAAGASFPRRPQEWVQRFPWGAVTLGLALGLLTLVILNAAQAASSRFWPVDLLMGAVTSTLLIYCTRFRSRPEAQKTPLMKTPLMKTPLVLRLLESRILVGLGLFSYSLYLIHGPLLAALIALTHHRLDVDQLTLFMLVVGIPITVAGSFLFYSLFERPFLHMRTTVTNERRGRNL